MKCFRCSMASIAAICLGVIGFCFVINATVTAIAYAENQFKATGYDATAPIVTNVSFGESIIRPGLLKVTFGIVEEETGVSSFRFSFSSIDGPGKSGFEYQELTWQDNPKYSGRYVFYVPISSSQPVGEYYLSYIEITDKANNTELYNEANRQHVIIDPNTGKSKVDINSGRNSVFIENEFDVDFQYYITNPNIESRTKSMPEGTAAMIVFDGKNHIARKAFFDAVKGKDKTLVFSNDGIQWVVNGNDVVETAKDVDLLVKTRLDNAAHYGADRGQLAFLDFPENGVLPGKMKVRIKTGYVVAPNLNLYHYDDEGLTLESTKNSGYYDGDNKWSEIEVTHNSNFLLTNQKLVNAPKNVKAAAKGAGKLQVSWSKSAGAKKYQLTYSTDKSFKGSSTKSVVTTQRKATLDNLKRSAKYYVKVRPYTSASKYGVYGKVIACKTSALVKAPQKVKLSTIGSKKLQVSWQRVDGAKKYHISYSTSKAFGKKTTKSVITSKCKATLTKLVKGKRYYLKVRATAGTKYGDYSKVVASQKVR